MGLMDDTAKLHMMEGVALYFKLLRIKARTKTSWGKNELGEMLQDVMSDAADKISRGETTV